MTRTKFSLIRNAILAFSGVVPLAAQSLSLSCPAPQKFNQAAVCQIVLSASNSTPISGAQWTLATNPQMTLAVASLVSGKSIGVGPTGIYMLAGANQTTMTGAIANITLPAHSGVTTITLSAPLGTSPTGHAVPLSPGASVTVQ